MINKLLSLRVVIIVSLITFIIGMATGAWSLNKFYAIGEVNRLESYIKDQKLANSKTIANITALHKKQIKIAADNVKIEKVIEYVPDIRECDINADTERLLDVSRTGMSLSPGRTNDTTIGFTPITQRQQIESCARDGIGYQLLKAQMIGLQQFIRDNRK